MKKMFDVRRSTFDVKRSTCDVIRKPLRRSVILVKKCPLPFQLSSSADRRPPTTDIFTSKRLQISNRRLRSNLRKMMPQPKHYLEEVAVKIKNALLPFQLSSSAVHRPPTTDQFTPKRFHISNRGLRSYLRQNEPS